MQQKALPLKTGLKQHCYNVVTTPIYNDIVNQFKISKTDTTRKSVDIALVCLSLTL